MRILALSTANFFAEEIIMVNLRQILRNRKDHWERIYQKLSPTEVGWYQSFPEKSLNLIKNTCVTSDCRIIDVGGGTSKLSEQLLDQGYTKLTVLDISGNSIEKAKSQLGVKSSRIAWIEADVTKYSFNEQYDVWHDRAVFHFLTKCSGLSVVRYSPESLQNELGDNFNLVESFIDNHVTPSGVSQRFIYCRFVKHA